MDRFVDRPGIIPALAGNTRRPRGRHGAPGDHPRSRGEYPARDLASLSRRGSSPLSRGIRGSGGSGGGQIGIIPALAGNTRVETTTSHGEKDHPRSRGEYKSLSRVNSSQLGSSPLSRGILMTSPGAMWRRPDHPRSRGEYKFSNVVSNLTSGSSPLSRGILRPRLILIIREGIIPALAGNTLAGVHHGDAVVRIIPALAGNTRPMGMTPTPGTDHPRSRGEYAVPLTSDEHDEGSSPLSRGIQAADTARMKLGRIIPALAGNTQPPGISLLVKGDHPRSRGEYGRVRIYVDHMLGSSPLSRGILFGSFEKRPVYGIIPALAGNTAERFWCEKTTPDHPRSRGEYIAT